MEHNTIGVKIVSNRAISSMKFTLLNTTALLGAILLGTQRFCAAIHTTLKG